jgi:hypothetical protein
MPKKNRRRNAETSSDPLGKLIQSYRPSVATVVGLAVVIFLAGVGVLIYCQFHHPYPFRVMLVGIFLLLMAPVLVLINALHFGSRLEVRRHGVRLHERAGTSELTWEEIGDVEVKRTDVTSLGVATVWTRSSDLRKRLLPARTEWEIILHTRDGRTLRLSPGFLQYVPDVRSLIVLLRKSAGLR